ncbi:MAG: hypothetical protein WKF30_06975 [Pyrinomonadaceae bacterium]
MKLYKHTRGAVIEEAGGFRLLPDADWDELVNRDDLSEHLTQLIAASGTAMDEGALKDGLLAPLGKQEVWAPA